MSVEAIQGRGVNRANATCDVCGRVETVTCDYARDSAGAWSPKVGQVHQKVTQHGWALVKGKLHCPACEAKRKSQKGVKMAEVKERSQAPVPKEPTRKERLRVIQAIMAVWDEDAERYQSDYTDRTVAEEIGVMPGWVKLIREENFGGTGGNAEIEALQAALSELEEQLATSVEAARALMQREAEQATKKYADTVAKRIAEVSALRARVDNVEAGLDLRVGRRA